MEAIIAVAQKELFFSGDGLERLVPFRDELLTDAAKKIHIRMLTTDIDDETVVGNRAIMFGRLPVPAGTSLKILTDFVGNPNIEIRTTKFPQPIIISARDMSKEAGLIRVAFPDYGEIGGDYPCVDMNPSDIWYEHYKNQIELLWAQGTPWPPPTKEGTP